jgi:hypothetical protein
VSEKTLTRSEKVDDRPFQRRTLRFDLCPNPAGWAGGNGPSGRCVETPEKGVDARREISDIA